jgi:hypothetical protein
MYWRSRNSVNLAESKKNLMSKHKNLPPLPEHPIPQEKCPLDPEEFGKQVLRLCEVAKAYGIPTVIDMHDVTIVITPKES